MTTNERTVGRYLCWLLAALSAGAAFIHFAVSGEHYEPVVAARQFFAVIVWLQLAFAVGVILRPNRRLLVAGVVLNAGIIGVWAMSRDLGRPDRPRGLDPGDGGPGRRAVVCVRGRHRRALARRNRASGIGVAAVASCGRIARRCGRGAGRRGGFVDGGRPRASLQVTATAAPSGRRPHAQSRRGRKSGAHAGHAAIVSNAPRGDTPCEQSGPPASAGQIASAGGHGHRGPTQWQTISDRGTRDQLGQQLDIAHQVTLQYPTVADAEADGTTWSRGTCRASAPTTSR